MFKRAEWHSGLTYKQVCRECKTTVEYNDYSLDFRPWYADGFVYCPRCNTPLRHNENFAINNPCAPAAKAASHGPAEANAYGFCTKCGNPYNEGDLFCAKCGNKK